MLIVDDDAALRQMLSLALSLSKDPAFDVAEAGDLDSAMESVQKLHPDVVLMDLSLPGADGDEITRRILAVHPSARVLAHTGHREQESITRMLVAGACGYVVKGGEVLDVVPAVRDAYLGQLPIDSQALPGLVEGIVQLARSEAEQRSELERAHHELAGAVEQGIEALEQALRSRSFETSSHVDRVEHYCTICAEQLGLDSEAVRQVRYGAVFHDIGKIGVPDDILNGQDELTPEQWEVIRQHTIIGEKILIPVARLTDAASFVRSSHENFDGSGYPDKLSGDAIPLGARIIRVCDTFDAMTSDRKYQDQSSHEQAKEHLREQSGKAYDPKVVQAFLQALKGTSTRGAS